MSRNSKRLKDLFFTQEACNRAIYPVIKHGSSITIALLVAAIFYPHLTTIPVPPSIQKHIPIPLYGHVSIGVLAVILIVLTAVIATVIWLRYSGPFWNEKAQGQCGHTYRLGILWFSGDEQPLTDLTSQIEFTCPLCNEMFGTVHIHDRNNGNTLKKHDVPLP